MSQTPARASRAVASIVASGALFVAIPVALVRVTRFRFDSANPFSKIEPPWRWSADEVRTAISEPLRDDAVVNLLIRASLAIVWVTIAVIATSVVIEVIHMVRHRGLPSPRVRGLVWAQRPGRWIAFGLVALLPLDFLASTGSAVVADSPAAMSQQWAEHPDAPASPIDISAPHAPTPPSAPRPASAIPSDEHIDGDERAAPAAEQATPSTTYRVAQGDSVFGIAAALTGDDAQRTISLADRILDLNLGNVMNDGQRFTNPALIQPGWLLTMPGDATPPVVDERVGQSASATSIEHVVVEGDTLSEIAEQHLGDSDAWPTIWAENANEQMADGREFDDPNLILPGWELDVPVSSSGTPETIPADEPAQPRPTIDVDPARDDSAHVDATVSAVDEPDVGSTGDAPTPPRGIPRTAPDDVTTPRASVPVPIETGPIGDATPPADPAPQSPSPIRLEHGALLAAGLLTLVGVRRRRALRAALPHARVPTPPPEVAATERRLRVVDAGERAARVDVAVRAAAHHVANHCQIGTVRVARDGEVIIRFTEQVDLSAPWVPAHTGGSSATWTLPAAVPVELLAEDARKVGQPCLALVTVGLDDEGRDVLIDLEAAGLTVVEGSAMQADEIVRALGSGLAASLTSEVVHLVVAHLGAGCLFDHPNARHVDAVDRAVDAALALVGSTAANERTSFELRTRRTGGEMWEPAVLLFDVDDEAASRASLERLPSAGHGIATVVATSEGSRDLAAGARLTGEASRWVLTAFGEAITVSPIGVSVADVAEVAQVLAEADAPIASTAVPPDVASTESESGGSDPFVPIDHEVVVRLMGGVQITDRAGVVGSFERSKTVELIAWLATHRERATRTAARTALWELDVRDATFANVVSEARRGLGRLVAPPDGDEWVARTLNESLPLHGLVVTDADLIEERVEHARLAAPAHAIEVLRPAVEMIRDMPFAGTSYLWPDADGLTSNLVLLATTTAAELAGHALSLGDTDLVFWATSHGLQVLPGHEELIGLRMRAHARAGDLSGVRQEWESYERVIMADSWSDGEPAPKLLDLRRQLLSPNA